MVVPADFHINIPYNVAITLDAVRIIFPSGFGGIYRKDPGTLWKIEMEGLISAACMGYKQGWRIQNVSERGD